MSRVGKRIIHLPEGVTIEINGTKVEVKGKLGTLTRDFSPLIEINVSDGKVTTERANENKHTKQLHGTTNSLISGMVEGVSKGFVKELEIKGVGYKAAIKNSELEVIAGYSHPVTVKIPSDLKVELAKPTEVKVSGISKEKVGQLAAVIREIRRPNPYSGKGIRYKDEVILRKEGKAASK